MLATAKQVFGGLLAGALISGCQSYPSTDTDLTSFTDPAYRGYPRFASVMVYGDRMMLEDRMLAESRMADDLSALGVRVYRSIDHAPPTRGDPFDQLGDAVRRTGVDALLILSIVDLAVEETYVPRTYHPGRSHSTITMYGDYGTVDTYTSPGYSTGGYTVAKPQAMYGATLLDADGFEIAWQADGVSSGNAYADFTDLTLSASSETVRLVAADGLLILQPPGNI